MWKVTPYLCPYNMHYIDTVGRFVSLLVCLQYTSPHKHVCIQYASVCISMCMYASKMHTRVLYTERVRALQRQGLSVYDKVTCAYRCLHTHTHIFTPRITLTQRTNPLIPTLIHVSCIHIHSHTLTPNIHVFIHTTYLQCKYMEITCLTTYTRTCQVLNLLNTYTYICQVHNLYALNMQALCLPYKQALNR